MITETASNWRVLEIPDELEVHEVIEILKLFSKLSRKSLTHVVVNSKVVIAADLDQLMDKLKESESLQLLHIKQTRHLNTKARNLARTCLPNLQTLSTTEHRFRDQLVGAFV